MNMELMYLEVERARTIRALHRDHALEPGNECMECGVLACPHSEPLHFDKDGCPACTQVKP